MRHETVISCNPFTVQVQYNTIRTLILYGLLRSMFKWEGVLVEEREVWHLMIYNSDIFKMSRICDGYR